MASAAGCCFKQQFSLACSAGSFAHCGSLVPCTSMQASFPKDRPSCFRGYPTLSHSYGKGLSNKSLALKQGRQHNVICCNSRLQIVPMVAGSPNGSEPQQVSLLAEQESSIQMEDNSTMAAPCLNTQCWHSPSSFFQSLQGLIPSHVLRVCATMGLAVILTTTLIPAIAHASSATHSHTTIPAGTLLTSAWTGLAAGCLHTLSGPDHLAALAPLSIGRSRMESAVVGALWGCGHDVGQVLFGALFLVLRERLHLEVLRVWGARVVGLTLIAIGGLGFFEAQHTPIQCDPNDEECLSQPGAVAFSANKQSFNVATFATGVVHGLQPDALLVILPALALPSKMAGAAFLTTFLLGTIAAMGSYTAFIGTCSDALKKRVPWLTQRLSFFASMVALVVGLGILSGDLFGITIFS